MPKFKKVTEYVDETSVLTQGTGRAKFSKISKTIPIPTHNTDRMKRHPAHLLEIGDSYFVDQIRINAMANLGAIAKRTGRKFYGECRTENGIEGTRVWRTR